MLLLGFLGSKFNASNVVWLIDSVNWQKHKVFAVTCI